MFVTKRGNKWQYRFDIATVDNKRKRVSKGGFDTKKEAEIAGNKALEEYNNAGSVIKISNMSVADFYTLWMNEYVRINCKKTTQEGYQKKLKYLIIPRIGHFRLSSLSAAVLQKLINDLFNEGFSRNTLICIKALLTGALDYAVQPMGYIKFNPAHSIRLPSHRATPNNKSRRKERIPITDEQMEIILNRFPEGTFAHLPLQLAWHLGMRKGEVFGLQWTDIDWEKSIIFINHQVQIIKDKKILSAPKYDSIRVNYIDSSLYELLERIKQKQDENREYYKEFYIRYFLNDKNEITREPTQNELFFVNVRENGEYIQDRILAHTSRIIHYQLGFNKFDFHSLRHTHTTKLYENGAPFVDIKERLGHCDLKTTFKYTHDTETIKSKTNELIENVFGKTKK